jgi:hypothetical protein
MVQRCFQGRILITKGSKRSREDSHGQKAKRQKAKRQKDNNQTQANEKQTQKAASI